MPDHQTSPLTESELYARMIDNLKRCEDDATQLAYKRLDKRWAMISALFHQLRQRCTSAAMRRAMN